MAALMVYFFGTDLSVTSSAMIHFLSASLLAFAIGKVLVQRRCRPTIQADLITAIVIYTAVSAVLREGDTVVLAIGFLSDFFTGWALYAGVMWKRHSVIR